MPNNFETLEEARAEIIRLNDVITERTNERDALQANYDQMTVDYERVRQLNQNYFNRLAAQQAPPTEPDEPEPLSCVELAKTIKF